MNHIYRLVWNKKRNMLMAVAETASTQGKDGAGETDAPGARRTGTASATLGARSLLAAAILAIFPLASFAQQQYTIVSGSVAALADSDGSNAAASNWQLINNGGLDISATQAGSSIRSLGGYGNVVLGDRTLTLTNGGATSQPGGGTSLYGGLYGYPGYPGYTGYGYGADGYFFGNVSGSGGLAITGGTEFLGGVNGYTGATTVGTGSTLGLMTSGSVASSSGVVADGVFDITSANSAAQIQSLSGSGGVLLGAQTLTLTNARDAFAGAISGTGNLAVNGGTQALGGTNTYTGGTTIGAAGTLALTGAGSIAASSGVAADGVLDIAATSNGAQIKSLSGAGTVNLGNQTLTLTQAGATSTTSVVTNPCWIICLPGLYPYPSSSYPYPYPYPFPYPYPGTVTVNNTGAVFSGNLTGDGGLAVTGGSESLGGTNTYTGATSIATGATLGLTGAGSIALSSGVAADGTFDISATSGGAHVQSLSGSGSVLLGTQTLTLTHAGDTFAGTLSGSGGLAVDGGTQTLTGAHTYTGATAIGAAGTLALAGAGSVAASSGVTADGVLDISATAGGAQIKSLTGSGTVLLGDQTLTLTNAGGTSTQVVTNPGWIGGLPGLFPYPYPFPGIPTVITTDPGAEFFGSIAGAGGLTIAGGTETLGGVNTYTGATTIATGATLGLTGAGSIAQSSGVAADGVFDIAATSNGAQVQSLSGSGSVLLGGQTLTLTDAHDVFAGTMSGAGGLAVDGGTQVLGNAQTHTGATTIGTAATLVLSGPGSIAASSGVADNGVFDISATNGAQVRSLSGSGSVLLGGQTLTLTNAAADFAGTLSGSGGLAVAGGVASLSGVNTYTGATAIAMGGTLGLAGAGSIAASSGVAADGVFDIAATNDGAQVRSLSGSGSVLLGGQTLTLTNAADVFAGAVSGSGGLAVTGGLQTLSGAQAYSGATTIGAAGTLALAGAGSVAASSGVAVDGTFDVAATDNGAQIRSLSGSGSVLLGAQTLTLTHAGDVFAGTASGAGGLAVTGGTQVLGGMQSYTGATTIGADATLALAGPGSIALSAGVDNDGRFDIAAAGNGAQIQSLSGSGSVILGGQTLTLAHADGVFAGNIAGSGGLAIAAGSETLTGRNGYTGLTAIAQGASLSLAGDGSIAGAVASDGSFDVSASAGAAVKSLSGSGAVLLGAQTLTLTDAAGRFDGAIVGHGGLTVAHGSETLGGQSNYTGATVIADGARVELAGSGGIALSSGVAADGVFDIARASAGASVQRLSGSGAVLLGGQTLTLTHAGDVFAGHIGGSGGLAVAAGTETLSGANGYTGTTTIGHAAGLALRGAGSIALSSVADDGTFDIAAANGDVGIKSLSGSGSVLLGGHALTLTGAQGVFAGSIGGSGGLALAAGTETLTGHNGYTGVTAIGQGSTLALAGPGSIAASSGVAADGTLNIAAAAHDTAVKRLSGSGSVVLGDRTLTLTDAAGTFGGAISGAGGLTIASGSATLSGQNTYGGTTAVGQGATLALAGNGSIAASSAVDNAGTFDIAGTGHGATLRNLAGQGDVALGGKTLTLTDASGVLAGSIHGAGGLTVGGGSATLSGRNDYSGATTIGTGATLALAGNGSIAASTVDAGGLFDIAAAAGEVRIRGLTGNGAVNLGGKTLTLGNAAGQFGGVIAGSGGLNVNGGTFTLAGINTYTGTTSVNGATLAISSARNLGAGQSAVVLNDGTLHTTASLTSDRALALTGQGTLDVAAGTTLTQTGAVAGSGTLVKAGTGVLTMSGTLSNGGGVKVDQGTLALAGSNSYTGGTTIGSGATVRIAGDASLGATGSAVNFAGGTLQTTGSLDSARSFAVSAADGHLDTAGAASTVTLNGTISGAGRLYKDGAGTLVLAGDNAGGKGAQNRPGDGWTGGLTVNDGVVKVTNAYGLGWGGVTTLNAGSIVATVDVLTGQTINMGRDTSINTQSGTTTTLAGMLTSSGAGNGCFSKTGSGTLNVTGTASIDATCVSEGKLLANGSYTGAITVAPGATLGGAGRIQGDVQVRGTLSPGNSPGMLTAAATVTMATGSTFKEDIGGSQQASASSPIGATGYYSYLHVTGGKQFVIQPGVTLAPALKNLYSANESGYGSAPVVPTLGQSYRIITADGGIVGRFDTLTQPDGLASGTRLAAFYGIDSNTGIELKVLPASYSGWFKDGNRNARSAAAALDRIAELQQSGNGSAAQERLLYSVTSYDAPKLGTLAKGLAGEVHGALAAAAPRAGWNLQRSVLKHNGSNDGRALWLDIDANRGDWGGDQMASGFTANTIQVTLGADLLRTPGARLGVGASRASTNLSADGGSGTLHQNRVFVYGEAAAAGLVFDGIGSYGRDKADSTRSEALDPVVLKGHADGRTAMLGAGVRAPLEAGGAKVAPFARVTVQKAQRDAYAETPAALAGLALDRFSGLGTRVVAGLSGDSRNTDPLKASTWRFSVGAGVDAGALARPAVGASLAGVGMVIATPDNGRGFVQGSVTGTLQVKQGAYLYYGVNAEAHNGYNQLGGNGGMRVVF